MKDFLGKEITEGKTIVYPIRRGSWVGMGKARVFAVGGNNVLSGIVTATRNGREYEMVVSLAKPSRCVVVD